MRKSTGKICIIALSVGWSLVSQAQQPTFVDVTPPVRNEPLDNRKTDPAANSYQMGDPDPLTPTGSQAPVPVPPPDQAAPTDPLDQEVPPPAMTQESSSEGVDPVPTTPTVQSQPLAPSGSTVQTIEMPAEELPPPPSIVEKASKKSGTAKKVATKKSKKSNQSLSYSPTAPENPDDPDEGLEKRLNQNYRSYNSTPTSSEKWAQIAGPRASESYSVQTGDTLWDVSQTLFGDPQFWPKVWSLNKQITNPHLISVGQSVRFYAGTVSEPPTLEVGKTTDLPAGGLEDGPAQATATPTPTLAQNGPAPIPVGALPEGTYKTKRLVREFPDSIPPWILGARNLQNVRALPLKIELRPRPVENPMIPLPYFATYNSFSGVGAVEEMENGSTTAGQYQYVFIKLDAGANAGDHFYIAKDLGKIATGLFNRSPRLIEIQGEVEVINVVNASKSIYRAIVKESLHTIEVGSEVFNGSMPTYNRGGVMAATDKNAKIVGGQMNIQRALFSDGSIVFLNQGSVGGMSTGDVLNIYQDHADRNPSTVLTENDRKIGELKIILVEEHFSTAVILSSNDDIRVGDRTFRENLSAESVTDVTDDVDQELEGDLDSGTTSPDWSDDYLAEPKTEAAPDESQKRLEEELDF